MLKLQAKTWKVETGGGPVSRTSTPISIKKEFGNKLYKIVGETST